MGSPGKTYRGIVVPGRGFGAQRMANPAVLHAAHRVTALTLVPGTLNVRLPQPFDGLFRCVRAHLAPGGTCILNVFHPQGGFAGVQQAWESMTERGRWEVTVDGVRLRCEERWLRLDPERHIL